MFEYQNPEKMSRDTITKCLETGSVNEICQALLSMAFYEDDWMWSQNNCLAFLSDSNPQIRGLAAICLGHIARVHGVLDKDLVVRELKKHINDQEISGKVDDALDDIAMFVK